MVGRSFATLRRASLSFRWEALGGGGPGAKAREPAGDVAAEFGVVGAEFFAEGRLFVEEDEEMDAENDGDGGDDDDGIGLTEDDPEADPAGKETQVHGIADVTVKPNDN